MNRSELSNVLLSYQPTPEGSSVCWRENHIFDSSLRFIALNTFDIQLGTECKQTTDIVWHVRCSHANSNGAGRTGHGQTAQIAMKNAK